MVYVHFRFYDAKSDYIIEGDLIWARNRCLGRPCLKTSLWRHTVTDFHDFGINGKRRPYPILWYQTITLWACQFQVRKGGVVTTFLQPPHPPPPLVNHVTWDQGFKGLGPYVYLASLKSYQDSVLIGCTLAPGRILSEEPLWDSSCHSVHPEHPSRLTLKMYIKSIKAIAFPTCIILQNVAIVGVYLDEVTIISY